MVAIENEYGIFGGAGRCDHNYMTFLRDLIWSQVGNDVVLYTSKHSIVLSKSESI